MKLTHTLSVPFIGSDETDDEEDESLPNSAEEINAQNQQEETTEESGGGFMSNIPFIGGSDESDTDAEEIQTIASGRIKNIEDAPYTQEDVLSVGDRKLAEWKDDTEGSVIDPIGRIHRDFVAPSEVNYESDRVELPTEWAQVMYINDWPEQARAGFLEQLFSNSVYKTDVSIHLEPRDQKRAMNDLKDNIGELQAKLEEEMKGSSVNARDTQKDLNDAQQMYDLVSRSNMTMFDCSMYVTHRSTAYDELTNNMNEIRGLLEKPPASTDPRVARRRQDTGMVSSSPIGADEMNKKTPMMGGAIGAMMPFSSSTFIEEGGVDFGVQPYNGSPVIVDRFGRSMGYNMLTVGNIGSGKSFSTKLNLVRTMMRQEDVDIVMLDPLQGFIGITEALNGNRIVVGGDVGLNPLELQETPQYILDQADGDLDPYSGKLKDVMSFFDTFFDMRNMTLSDDRGILEKAVQNAYADKGITNDPETHGKESPTMKNVLKNLREMAENGDKFAFSDSGTESDKIENGASRLLVALQPFRDGGEFENLAKKTEIDISQSRVTYLDLQQQEGRGGTGLMMQLLFNAVYERAKNTQNKVIFAIDEARYIMKDASNLEFLEQAVRHSRHYNLSIQFITQTVDEFFSQDEAEAIANNCSLMQLNRVEGLDDKVGREKLNMNQSQIEYVRNAQAGSEDLDYSSALMFVQEYGWMPIHIKASSQEAAVVDFDPDEETKEDALPGYTSSEDDAKSARIQQALKASSSDDRNVQEVGGDNTIQDKFKSVGSVPKEAKKSGQAQLNKEKLDDLEKDDLVDLIQSGEYGTVVSDESVEKPEAEPEPEQQNNKSESDTTSNETWERGERNRMYHIRIIAEQTKKHDSMPVLDALEDAFTVVGTDPSKDAIRAGGFGIGFDAIIVTPIIESEIDSALTEIKRVTSVEVSEITDDVDLNREAGQMASGVDVDSLIAHVDAENSTETAKIFEEIKRETSYTPNYDEIKEEMDEIGMDEVQKDEVSFQELIDDDEFDWEDEE